MHRALAEPARLGILHALEHGPLTVTELVAKTGLGQGNLSKHLQQLHATGFLSRTRKGLFVHYALADDDARELPEILAELDADDQMITPVLAKLRHDVMELYISDHPLDCLTCSANGDCELQTQAGVVGLRNVRYGVGAQAGAHHCDLPRDESNPYFSYDPSKCIVCNRCVRACEETQGTFALTISGRGYIKRQPVATYRRQHRGGKGIIGHVTREEDAVDDLLLARAMWRASGSEKDAKTYISLSKEVTSCLSTLGLDPSARGRLGLAQVKARSRLEEMRDRKLRAGHLAG